MRCRYVQQHLGEAAILVDVETTDDKMIEWNKEQSFDNNKVYKEILDSNQLPRSKGLRDGDFADF